MSAKHSSSRYYFCRQLASWLQGADWHFATLLATCIEIVNDLPDDCDKLINELLLKHSLTPSQKTLTNDLINSNVVSNWFLSSTPPCVNSINLQATNRSELIHPSLPLLDTLSDLSTWLNVSSEQLEWLVDLKRYSSGTPSHLLHYHYHTIQKRNGSLRLIESPKTLLKGIQRKILDSILSYTQVHHAAHGFIKNRDCLSNARLHTNKQHLFLFDLAHYFHSIQWHQVYRVFRNLGYSPAITKYLSGLCTHRSYIDQPLLKRLDKTQLERLKQTHLPQGAPTSPALSNAILYALDKRLYGLAEKLGLSYSRYADDLAFSGRRDRDWRFLESLVGSICLDEGFELNHRKSRHIQAHQKQRVTGIIVNEKVNIDRRYYDELKAILTNCVRHGVTSQNHSGHPYYKDYLLGRIQHVKQINENKGKRLEAIYNRIA